MPPLRLCHFKKLPIFEQLELEEALLRTDQNNWCIINEQSTDAIVMGISAKPDDVINKQEFVKKPIPVIRRFSGGGTVLIEKNTLFVTFIVQQQDVQLDMCPKQLLDWTGHMYSPLFSHVDFAIRENDYAIDDKKVGGNAQYFARKRMLHHTSFLWDYCPEYMKVLKMPPKIPEYRRARSHDAFLTKLCHYFKSKDAFMQGVKKALARHFRIQEHVPDRDALLLRQYRRTLSYVNVDWC